MCDTNLKWTSADATRPDTPRAHKITKHARTVGCGVRSAHNVAKAYGNLAVGCCM
jgi:hypothetical protein